jgi:hypothetical protein
MCRATREKCQRHHRRKAVLLPADGGTGSVFSQEDVLKAPGREARVAFRPCAKAGEKFRHVLCPGEAPAVEIVAPAEGEDPAFSREPMKLELTERKASNVPEKSVLFLAVQKIRLISEALREDVNCEEIERLLVSWHRCSLCQWKLPICVWIARANTESILGVPFRLPLLRGTRSLPRG